MPKELAARTAKSEYVGPWAADADDVLKRLEAHPGRGLSEREVEDRRARFGANELRRHRKRKTLSILIDQFRSLIVGLLVVAAVVAFAFGETIEAWSILAVILLNAALGFVTELRAVRSMEALFRMGRVTSKVRRSGPVQEVSAQDLVPGDIVLLEAGDIVSADLRITEASRLQADESALTGESVPVDKGVDRVDEDAPLVDRTSMLYKGTAVTRGSGEGVVVSTGMGTELGRISSLIETADDEQTPLEIRLDLLGRKLIWITLGIAAAVTLTGLLRGKPVFLMIETGIALAVASIPEGLPIVATIALARGVHAMARRNALINRLSSVETLGSAGVICTDKTGTLTENRMTVVRMLVGDQDVIVENEIVGSGEPGRTSPRSLENEALRAALEVSVLCNNAELGDGDGRVGDPMEMALLEVGRWAGMERAALIRQQPEVREEAFETSTKMMATYHTVNGHFRVAVKGAPEAVLEACTQWRSGPDLRTMDEPTRATWMERNGLLAAEGLRVLAVAEKLVDESTGPPYEALTLLGLIGMADPPREDVRPAIDKCRQAGIQVVMVTGDQPVTALKIAQAVGLADDGADVIRGADLPSAHAIKHDERDRLLAAPVFARVTPEQKLDLIALHQEAGRIVAMTGDGVNDAPALKKADIGIAMGQRGTQVAREAADMVLRDDAFSSIVAAIEQGRVIFGNIRRFVFYLLSCNVSEVMVVGLATLFGGPLPILPLQILFLNLVTDIFPALALGMGDGDPQVMDRRPRRPEDAILKTRHWRAIGLYGALITASVLTVLFVGLGLLRLETQEAVTASFLTLALAQLWHVFNMRGRGTHFFVNEVTTNPYVWAAVGLCGMLIGSAVYTPAFAEVLKITPPDPTTWILILSFSLVPFAAGQIVLSSGAPKRARESSGADAHELNSHAQT